MIHSIKSITFFYAVIMLATSGCDYVDNPTPMGGGLNTSCDTVFTVASPVAQQKNVLLEDFSGHKCPNCPDAAEEAEAIHASIGDRLVTVTIHPDPNIVPPLSQFVIENSPGSGMYETVWYIPEGGEIIVYYGNPGFLPIGMVDRTINTMTGNRYFDWQIWQTTVNNRLTEPLEVSLAGKAELLSDGETVCGQVKVEFLSTMTPLEGIRVVHYLVEDSISDWQLDQSTNVPNYMHRHVLRAVYNSNIFGELVLPAGTISAGTLSEHFFSFDSYTVVNPDNLHVISYVYDKESEEVLQVITYHVSN